MKTFYLFLCYSLFLPYVVWSQCPQPTGWDVSSNCGPDELSLVAQTATSNISYHSISHRWYTDQNGSFYYSTNSSKVKVLHHSAMAYVTELTDHFTSNDS